jgi:hypothetical protein
MASRIPDPLASIRSEGALLPADFLARLTEPRPQIEGLAPESYHLAGERLGEAASRAWSRLQGVWTAFREARERLPESDSGTSLTRERWLLPLFQELGYGRLLTTRALEVDGKTYAVSHLWHHTPIHLISFRRELDRAEPGARGAARSTPHGLVQELLNRSDAYLWGMVSNGVRLRLLRDGSALARQAYVEWDLEYLFENELYSDFLVLWLVCHQSRVEADRPEECWLERWAREAQQQGIRAYEELRKGVQGAIEALGRGFLSFSSKESANDGLRERLERGELDGAELYRQLLRVVYRLLFLMVAEERGLLHPREADPAAVKRYADFFSLGRLRRLADRSPGSRHPDLLRALRLVFDKLGSDEGCPELGLPALGGFLFSPGAAEALDGCDLDNHHLLTAVRALAFVGTGRARRPVSFKELGARELGSVYESLLELVPVVNARAGTFELRTASGNERKTTGSYYTPEPLIQALLDSALQPVLDNAARKPDWEAAILGLRVCDPACGSGHFLISAAHRIAHRLATLRSGGVEPSVDALNHARRDVIGHCLYGVDLNPMAVELCKVSLWLEALEPGKPLAFLENRVKQGNSLLGATPALLAAGIPDEAFTAIEGDDKEYVKKYKRANKEERKQREQLGFFSRALEPWDRLGDVTAAARVVEAVPDDTLPSVRRKESEYEKMIRSASYRYSRLWADAWCAAFVWKKTNEFPSPITEEIFRDLERRPHSVKLWMEEEIRRLAKQYGFFHWHIEFPDVFRAEVEPQAKSNDPVSWTGGFDLVVGNPPWERIKLQEKEWFATRAPEIATALNAAARHRLIERLATENPELFSAFLDDSRKAEGESHFVRRSNRYPMCGRGDVNTYAPFAEFNRHAISTTGRVGCIVPSGIATDDTTRFFFGDLMHSGSIVSLFSFKEIRDLFLDTDSRNPFCLLTLTGKSAPSIHAEFAFELETLDDLQASGRRFRLSAADINLVNPNTKTCPVFRTHRDAEITKAVYRRLPILLANDEHSENPWGMTFQRMFDMANDSGLFRTAESLEEEGFHSAGNLFHTEDSIYLPLYEAKMFHHYNHRFGDYRDHPLGSLSTALPQVPEERLIIDSYTVRSRYWVDRNEIRIRAARLPQAIVNAYMFGDENHAEAFLLAWLAGHHLAGGDAAGADFIIKGNHDSWASVSPAMRTLTAASRMAAEYPLSDAELSIIARAEPALVRVDCLLEARFPGTFLGWRDICRNTDERTVISSTLPRAAVGHTSPLVIMPGGGSTHALLQGIFSSFVFDYVARQKIGGTHLTYGVLGQLPVIPPDEFQRAPEWLQGPLEAWIRDRVLELVYTALDVSAFAQDCGYDGPPFRWDEERRFLLRCELDAAFFHLYGIERADVDYIMDTFPIVRRKDEAAHGEYRTKRVILEIYDEMAQAARTGTPYQTRLDPPPADPRVAHPAREQGPVEA